MRNEYLDDWPDCPVPGCAAKICIALNSTRCFEHTSGNAKEKRREIGRQRQSTLAED